jgi:hypothetical protein
VLNKLNTLFALKFCVRYEYNIRKIHERQSPKPQVQNWFAKEVLFQHQNFYATTDIGYKHFEPMIAVHGLSIGAYASIQH